MPVGSAVIRPFEPRTAADQEFVAINDFHNALEAEQLPDDPRVSLEERITDYRAPAPREERYNWVARQSGSELVVAMGRIWISLDEENRHLAGFRIQVRPEWRRMGIGKRLLSEVAGVARSARREALTAWTYVADGEPFMRRIGAEPGNYDRISQLELHDLDHELLRQWVAKAAERAGGFRLDLWDDGYPEACLEEAAAMQEAMNYAPRGTLPQGDQHFTAEDLRQDDDALRQRGGERWTLVARDPDGKIAGFTQIYRNPRHPELPEQGDTAVFPDYRNRGIGRWLKAVMLEELLRRHPEARRIRTSNAESNAAMLKINVELGFRPFHSVTGWHIRLDRMVSYLGA